MTCTSWTILTLVFDYCEIVLAIRTICVWKTFINFLKQNKNNQFCSSDDVFSFTSN